MPVEGPLHRRGWQEYQTIMGSQEATRQQSSAATSVRNPWRRRLLAIAFGLFVVSVVLLVAELGVRVFFPFVNFPGTDRGLFDADRPEEGLAWMPGATGLSCGAEVTIDEIGCRVVGAAKNPTRSWLVLGDSVAFGMAVSGDNTFTGLFQAAHPDIKVLNAAVCVTGPRAQLAAARRLLDAQPPVEHVTLFYCLNDLGNLEVKEDGLDMQTRLLHPQNRPGFVQQAIEFLRPRSKLYLLLKGIATDPSSRNFKWSLQNYKQWDPQRPGRLGVIPDIAKLVSEREIPFEVIVLPYEYQLRQDTPDVWLPQEKLAAYFRDQNVTFYDIRQWFQADGRDSDDYFLFADPCHLSELGHEVIYEHLVEELKIHQSPTE